MEPFVTEGNYSYLKGAPILVTLLMWLALVAVVALTWACVAGKVNCGDDEGAKIGMMAGLAASSALCFGFVTWAILKLMHASKYTSRAKSILQTKKDYENKDATVYIYNKYKAMMLYNIIGGLIVGIGGAYMAYSAFDQTYCPVGSVIDEDGAVVLAVAVVITAFAAFFFVRTVVAWTKYHGVHAAVASELPGAIAGEKVETPVTSQLTSRPSSRSISIKNADGTTTTINT